MALFTEERLRNKVKNQLSKSQIGSIYDSHQAKARMLLEKSLHEQRNFSATKTFDIFLSHSSNDAELVEGLKLEIEDMGYTVYVDWIEDPQLNREKVTKETAELLKQRMKNSTALIYAFSENAAASKWMPWELGYFDGIKGTVAVLPIANVSKDDFKGVEYLGIYYYIQVSMAQYSIRSDIRIHETKTKYVYYKEWLNGQKPFER